MGSAGVPRSSTLTEPPWTEVPSLESIESGSPSVSVSLASTSMVTAVSSAVTSASAAATGGSFWASTVMTKVWTAEVSTPPSATPPSSERVTDTVADPLASGAGVKVRSPLASSIEGWTKNSPLVSLVTAKVTVWVAASSVGPAEIEVA